MDLQTLVGPMFSLIAGVSSAWLTFAKLKKHHNDEVESKIKESIALVKNTLEAEVRVIEANLASMQNDIENVELSAKREIAFVKEAYQSEIKNLAEKIEGLRDQVESQHSQLVSLLTKLIVDK